MSRNLQHVGKAVALALLGVPSMVHAQSGERDPAPAGTTFTAGFAGGANAVFEVEIYTLHGGRGPDAVRVARRSRRTVDGPVVEGWTDTVSCPALERVVRDFVNLPGTDFIVSGLSTWSDLRPTPSPAADGGFPAEVWGLARQSDNAFAEVHMTASAGLLKDWVRLASAALEPCWILAEPGVLAGR